MKRDLITSPRIVRRCSALPLSLTGEGLIVVLIATTSQAEHWVRPNSVCAVTLPTQPSAHARVGATVLCRSAAKPALEGSVECRRL